jgi:hypothetical protein
MKYKALTYILLLANWACLCAQVTLQGKVTDMNGNSLPGANVSIKDTYDGVSADTGGCFRFRTLEQGGQILVVSYIGYKTVEREIDLSAVVDPIEVVMEEQAGEIKGVIVTAGAFETGELKRPIVLKPMDIATTPSAMGDIYGALTTLPGNQVVGNEGGLYVRGGEGYETKTYIDGMQVAKPYMSKMPDLPTRSRFSPLLFTGTAFSTGGCSAEYGQALSSVVNLNTTGIADKDQGTLSIMSVGLNGSYTRRWQNTSVSGALQYINMNPYYSLAKTNIDWEKPPEQLGGTMLLRQKFGKYGLLKVFGSFDLNKSALDLSYAGDTATPSLIDIQGRNYYVNALYKDLFREKWQVRAGISFTRDINRTGIDADRLDESVHALHQRLTISRDLQEKVSLKFGEEASLYFFNRDFYAADSAINYTQGFQLEDYAMYLEPEIRINDHFVARTGLRGECIPLTREWQLVPRISLAYRISDYSQLSMAYGLFRQRPEDQYLVYTDRLRSEKATHLIINYQYEVSNRIFRIELYRKWYSHLVKYGEEYNTDPENYSNNGTGYAQGIDLFWRDSKSIRDLDYWISYSFIDTKRNYRNYQASLKPSFISTHTFSAVIKYFIRKANTYAGLTYMYASPKTWYNPALQASASDQTRAFNDLSLNITSILPLFGSYCAVLLNVSNVLGFDNVYGYHYATSPDPDGNYTRYPILPQTKRFFIIGFYYIFSTK